MCTEEGVVIVKNRSLMIAGIATFACICVLACGWVLGSTYLETNAVARKCEEVMYQDYYVPQQLLQREISALGGKESALKRLRAYLRRPRWMAPAKDGARVLICSCGDAAIEDAQRFLKSPTAQVRSAAALLLEARGGAGIVEPLIRVLSFVDEGQRLRAIDALGELGSVSEPAVESLIQAASGESTETAEAVRRALVNIVGQNCLLHVYLDGEGRYFVAGRGIRDEDLSIIIREVANRTSRSERSDGQSVMVLIVDGDSKAPYSRIQPIMATCKSLGVQSRRIMLGNQSPPSTFIGSEAALRFARSLRIELGGSLVRVDGQDAEGQQKAKEKQPVETPAK